MLNQINQTIKFSSPKKISLWLPLIIISLAGAVLVGMVFAMLGYQVTYLDRAYPGVTVANIDVGGMTRSEIMAEVDKLASEYLNRSVTVRTETGNETWQFSGRQLGLGLDVVATADQAFQIGRRGNLFADMLTHLSLAYNTSNVEPLIRYDTGPTNQVLQELSQAINYPPQNARLEVGPEGSVDVILSQPGRRLHVGATQPLIEAAILGDGPQEVVAFTQQVLPAVKTEDLAELQHQARVLLNQPFVFNFSAGDDSVARQLDTAQLGAMLSVGETPDADGAPQFSLELDQTQLAPYFEEFALVINQDPADAALAFNDKTGELEVLQPSRDGQTLDVAGAYQQTVEAIANGLSLVQLPLILTPPAVSSNNLEALGITDLVSESTSYFAGSSAGRMSNIALAASKFNGVIIPPGEIFFFNEHLGPVTKESGFDESLIIYGDRTTVGIGGGVCQVSTTAFRTAFFGGFELVERWAHGYRVGWYETNSQPGLDATIYAPDVDLKFRNDTGHHLLIQTETDLGAGTITFKFYGTPTNREVLVSDPITANISKPAAPLYERVSTLPPGAIKQVDWAKEGMDVTVTRVVKQGDSIIHEDEIISRYRPWRAVYQVGLEPPPRLPVGQIRPQ